MEYSDFRNLWVKLIAAANKTGDHRFKAVLLNHESRPEYICKKLNVICEADVNRVLSTMKSREV